MFQWHNISVEKPKFGESVMVCGRHFPDGEIWYDYALSSCQYNRSLAFIFSDDSILPEKEILAWSYVPLYGV